MLKGIVHPKILIWCLSAYPKRIQDVGDFVFSVEHKRRSHRQNQIKPCGSWRYIEVLRHKTIGLCKKLNNIYIIFYLWSTAMSNCPERVHNIRRVTEILFSFLYRLIVLCLKTSMFRHEPQGLI